MNEGRDVECAPAAEDAVRSSGRNVIAVIGIDRYASWRRLTNAVSDARGAAELFRTLGFALVTEPLLDERATGDAIQALVTDDLQTLGPDDSLVLFYAGHGATRTHRLGDQVVKTGYLIPADASKRAATWIELDAWLRAISLLPAKHVLVILDACHSGIALGPIIKWRDTGTWQDTPLSTLKLRRSRRIITSALDDQLALDSGPVHGHSLFTGCLIEGLTHGLGQSGIRVTTSSELGMYLQRRVEAYPSSRQTPDFGTFDFDDRGEMVIPLAVERPVSEVSEGASAQGVVAALAPPGPSWSASSASDERTRPRRWRSRLPFAVMSCVVLAAIVIAVRAVSRGSDDTIEPAPPASSTASLDATLATAPAPGPDAAIAVMPPDAPADAPPDASPAVVTPPRPPASVPKAPAKIESRQRLAPEPKQKPPAPESKQKPPAPAVSPDGMLRPRGI